MYFEQENFPNNGDLKERIFVQKTGSQDGLYWILDLRSFRVIGLSDAQFHVTIVILQFEMSLEHQRSNLLVLQLQLQLELSEDKMLVLSSDDKFFVHG